MTWTHLRDSTGKTRKQRVCCLCGREIKIDTKAVNRVGVSFGKLQSDYMHPGCEELTHEWDAMDWETFSAGDGEWPEAE
jgi:hypothetical protein